MGQEGVSPGITGGLMEPASSTLKKNTKLLYSKDFLLSFADLESCKERPEGVYPVVLRDVSTDLLDGGVAIPNISIRGLIRRDKESDGISDSPPEIPEWRRPSSICGSSILQQGPRRSEPSGNTFSGSFTPRSGSNWADNGHVRSSFERPGWQGSGSSTSQGRWEHRSALGDRDRERNRSQHDYDPLEPDSGGRLHGGGVASIRPGWVSHEHDGLLGSGGGLRSNYTGGLMSSHSRVADRFAPGRMGRTGEHYHPPRPVKVSTSSRREDTDSVNDETFGPEEHSSEERSEQERKRRESFELIRKEHQRLLQEQQKTQSQKREELSRSNSSFGTARKHDEMGWDDGQNSESLLSSSPGTPLSSCSKDDSGKAPTISAVPLLTTIPTTPRPLVPPGFSKVAIQSSSSIKEDEKESNAHESKLPNLEEETRLGSKMKDTDEILGFDKSASLQSKIVVDEIAHEEDSWLTTQPKTSKFAQWFHPKEENPQGNSTTGSPNVLSLFSKSEDQISTTSLSANTRDGMEVSQDAEESQRNPFTALLPLKSQGLVLPMPVAPSLEDVERVIIATVAATPTSDAGVEEQSSTDHNILKSTQKSTLTAGSEFKSDNFFKPLSELLGFSGSSSTPQPTTKGSPVVLTCEDLEQSMLAEAVNFSEAPAAGSKFGGSQVLQSDPHEQKDDNASRHLLSLLQKGSSMASNGSSITHVERKVFMNSAAEGHIPLFEGSNSAISDQVADVLEENHHGQGAAEMRTLETLFGKAFMNELRSVGAPVSGKTLSDDSDFTGKEDGFNSMLAIMSSKRQSPSGLGSLIIGTSEGKASLGTLGHNPNPGLSGEGFKAMEGDHGDQIYSSDSSFLRAMPTSTEEKEGMGGMPAVQNDCILTKSSSQNLSRRGSHDVSSVFGSGSMSGSNLLESLEQEILSSKGSSVVPEGLNGSRKDGNELDSIFDSGDKTLGLNKGCFPLPLMVSSGGGKALEGQQEFLNELMAMENSHLKLRDQQGGPQHTVTTKSYGVEKAVQGVFPLKHIVSEELRDSHIAGNQFFKSLLRREGLEDMDGAQSIMNGELKDMHYLMEASRDVPEGFGLNDELASLDFRNSQISTVDRPSNDKFPQALSNLLRRSTPQTSSSFPPQTFSPLLQEQSSLSNGVPHRSQARFSGSNLHPTLSVPTHQQASLLNDAIFTHQRGGIQQNVPNHYQQLQVSFSHGNPVEVPLFPYGQIPESASSRAFSRGLPSGQNHFPPHHPHLGPITQQGPFRPNGHGAQFISPGHVPSRGVPFHSLQGHPFMHEHIAQVGPHGLPAELVQPFMHERFSQVGPHGLRTEHGQPGVSGVSGFPPDVSPFHPFQGGSFQQPGHGKGTQSGQFPVGHSSPQVGVYGMSPPFQSEFREPAHMGFNASNYMGGSGGVGGGISSPLEKWFALDSRQTSQSVPGFSPYQHPAFALDPDRKLGYG